MHIAFEKWHGARNDFLVVWSSDRSGVMQQSLVRQGVRLCDRHSGVGADGILILLVDSDEAIEPREVVIVNSDGSLAETCGNGLRCAAGSVWLRNRRLGGSAGQERLEGLSLLVGRKTHDVRFLTRSNTGDSRVPFVALEMGVPKLDASLTWWTTVLPEVQRVFGSDAAGTEVHACDIGNLHLVLSGAAIDEGSIHRAGPKFQKCESWDGINVHGIAEKEVRSQDVQLAMSQIGERPEGLVDAWVWERGAGATQACGSGACAIAASLYAEGSIGWGGWIAVDMPGGRLYVKQDSPSESMTLAGPAALVFTGVVEV